MHHEKQRKWDTLTDKRRPKCGLAEPGSRSVEDNEGTTGLHTPMRKSRKSGSKSRIRQQAQNRQTHRRLTKF